MSPCEVSAGLGTMRSGQQDWGLQFHAENARGSGSVGTEAASDLESFLPDPVRTIQADCHMMGVRPPPPSVFIVPFCRDIFHCRDHQQHWVTAFLLWIVIPIL